MRFSLSNLGKKEDQEKSSGSSKLKEHWGTIVSLLGIFIIALLVRSYFAFDIATNYGSPFLISGGSDAYYYRRVIDFITTNHHHLLQEPMLNYPIGRSNPRPPLFGWTISIMAYIFSPLVGDVQIAAEYVFMFSVGVWGALTIFPTYLIGRDIFGKKAGLTGALLLAISAAHLQRGIITNGDHDTFVMFFGVTGFYFFMRALKGIDAKRDWVQDWADKTKIKEGFLDFVSENKTTLLYAAMTGIAFGAVALAWQGYVYMIAIILVYYGLQLFVDKFKRRDSFGVTMCVMVSVSVTLLLAAPYYVTTGVGFNLPSSVGQFFDVPLLLFLGMMIVGVYFTVTRDLPWLFVLGVFAVTIATTLILGFYFFRSFMESLIGGGGYFIQTPLYATIAEAQSPGFSNLVLGTGVLTFFLSFTGIALAIWHLKKNWNPAFIFVLVWSAFAIYMAVSAARFMFNAAPAFALTAGWVVALAVDKANFPDVAWRIKTYRGNLLKGIYEGFKIKHISVILIVILLIFLPNAIHAFDAGIPYENKEKYDDQIYQSLPEFLRPPEDESEEANTWYLGAFGYSLDGPDDYWPAAWKWLRNQDTDQKPEDRPGFLSWWDYGFEAAGEGKHPSVADNFQTAYRFAGNVLMAQNESEILGLLSVRMLEKEIEEKGEFSESVRNILIEQIGEEKTNELEDVMENPRDEKYREEVLSNPDRYHPRDEELHFRNVKYAYTMGLLSYENVHDLADLYREICLEMDDRIKYLAVDTRLFPLSASQTGVFYAPAKLSGHRIDDRHGMRTPTDFYQVNFIDSERNVYSDPDDVPEDAQIVDQRIEYQSMFYNSALYNIFVGYSGSDIGKEEGIPGMEEELQDQQPMPSWNMTYFKTAYRTAYYNPYDDFRNHTDAWKAISYDEAIEKQQEENGTVDTSGMAYMRQGVIFLENFDGAIVEGTLKTEEGKPVPDATVTVLDEDMTVSHVTNTDQDGYYRAIAPPGTNNNMIVTQGDMERPILQTRGTQLGSYQFNVTEEMAMRKKVDRDHDGSWDYLIEKDFEIEDAEIDGHIFIDMDKSDETDDEETDVYDSQELASTENTRSDNIDDTTPEVDPGEEDMEINQEDGGMEINQEDGGMEIDPGDGGMEIDPGMGAGDGPGMGPGDGSEGDFEKPEYDEENDTVINGEVTLTHQKSGKSYNMETTEGYFNFEGLIPGGYSLETDVKGAESVDGLKVSPGQSITRDVEMTTGEANLEIEYGEEVDTAEEVMLEARHSETGLNYSTSAEEEGTYNLDSLIPGKYDLTVESDGYTFKQGRYRFEIQGNNVENISATITPAETVEGTALYKGKSLENQRISIISSEYSDFQTMVTTEDDGEFSVKLPEGEHRLYSRSKKGERNLVYMDLITTPLEERIEANFQEGYRVEGKALYRDSPEGSYNILFTHESEKELSVVTNSEGRFKTYLIPGDYDVYGWNTLSYRSSVSMDRIEVDETTSFDINIESGSTVSGTVSRDLQDSAEEPEMTGVRSDIEILIDDKVISKGRTSSEGYYEIVVPHRKCTVRFSAEGFVVEEFEYKPGDELKKNMSLYANDVTVSGDIQYETYLPDNIPIKFEGIGNGAVDKEINISGNEYAVDLQPGEYDVSVDHTFDNGDRKIYHSEVIEVEPGQEVDLDLFLKEQVRLTGIIKDEDNEVKGGEVTFIGTEMENITTDGEFEVYLSPGNYGVKATNRTEGLAAHMGYDLENASSIDIVMKDTYEYNTFVDYQGEAKQDVTVEIEHQESGFVYTNTTDDTGYASFSLAQGEYDLNIDHIEKEPVEGVLSRIRYYYSETKSAEELTNTIHLSRELYNSTLSGIVSVDGTGVEDLEIEFISNSPEAVSTSTTTGTDGEFEVELFHGMYTIYVSYRGSRLYSAFETFAMDEEDETLDIELQRASVVEGEVKRETGLESEVTFQRPQDRSERSITTNDQGYYEILIPNDYYKISSEKVIGDNTYSDTKNVEIQSSRTLDLNLKLVEEYGIEIGDISTVSASQGDVVNLEVDITNTGNVRDVFEMSAEKAVWDIGFSQQEFEINAGSTKTVELTVHVDNNASVAHPPISFEVMSQNSEEIEEREIPFDIERIYGVNIVPEIKTKTFRRGTMNYTLNIRNTGNAEDTFTLEVLDQDELMNKGWNATLSDENIVIGEGEDSDIILTLEPTRSNPNKEIEVSLSTRSMNDLSTSDSTSLKVESPTLRSDAEDLELKGEDISFEKEEFSLETWQWAAIVLLIGSIAVYIMKKERWI
ncbi:MAG: STT3 domain-containing protein [Candidatus Saliniplasma sp.]